MATQEINELIDRIIDRYINVLKENNIPVSRLYLYGSYAKGGYHKDSDIDIAVFLDKDTIDQFEEDVRLFKLTKNVDLRIEPHSFARTDLDEPDPYTDEIIRTGKRII